MPKKSDLLASLETYCLFVMVLLHNSTSAPSNATSGSVWKRETCSYEGLLRDLEICSFTGDRQRKEPCRELKDCLDNLKRKCHGNDDAMRILRDHATKETLRSAKLCRDSVSMETFQTKDTCFRSFINTTVSCSDALTKYLEKFLNTNNLRSACRLIGTVLNCFRDVLEHVHAECDHEEDSTFYEVFIQPSLDDVTDIVADHCSSHLPPFSTFFSSHSDILRTNPCFLFISFTFIRFVLILNMLSK